MLHSSLRQAPTGPVARLVAAGSALLSVCACASAEARAQAPEPAATKTGEVQGRTFAVNPPAEAAVEALAPLSILVGDWVVAASDAVEGEPTVTAEGVSSIAPMLGGAMLRETARIPGVKYNLTLENIISYDQFQGVYRVASMDKEFGLVSVFEGGLADGVLQVSDVRFNPSGPMNFRLTWDLRGPSPLVRIDGSVDGGATWREESRLAYAPQPE